MRNVSGFHFYGVIAALAITAYARTLSTGFLWDDHVMIENNSSLRNWSWRTLKNDFSTDPFQGRGDAYYRPLQTFFNRIDFSLWGLKPAGYHVTNLLFHVGNALLVYRLLLLAGPSPLSALLAACLFAVHPIVVEQLMIIAGRAELMGFFFTLLCLIFLIDERRTATGLAWIAYTLGLFSKESVLVTPLLAVMLFATLRKPRQAYVRLVPSLLITPLYFFLRHRAVGPIVSHLSLPFLLKFYFQAFPAVLLRYAGLILFPWNLHSHRMMPHLSHAWPLYLAVLLILAFELIRRKARWGFFCLGWFILVLLPKTPIMMTGNFMLDHWAYPAVLGVLWPLSFIGVKCWSASRHWVQQMAAAGYFGYLIVLALLVHLNVTLRGTDEKMYRWALNFTSSHPIKYNLGILLLQTRRPAEAACYLEDVRAAYPENLQNTNALAQAYWNLGHRWLAMDLLKHALQISPDDPLTHHNLMVMQDQLDK